MGGAKRAFLFQIENLRITSAIYGKMNATPCHSGPLKQLLAVIEGYLEFIVY